jgi:hypothetical protein
MQSGFKNTFVFLGIISLFTIWTAGCSTNRSIYGGPNKPALLKVKNLTTFNYTDKKADNYYLKLYNAAADEPGRKEIRNAILNDLLLMIDHNYDDFEDNLRNDKSTQEWIADLATLGLTAASTVVGGAETKTILSAIATGVVGVNTSLDKEFFQNNTVQALQLQMRAQRATVEAKLDAGMSASTTDYPLQNGVRDVMAYYHAGSVTEALIQLVQNAGDNNSAAQAALKK